MTQPKVDNRWKKKFRDEFYEGDDYTSNRYSNLVGFIEYEILPDIITQTQQETLEWVLGKIKECGPDLVCPIEQPPFREDYINKWGLIKTIKNKMEETNV